MKILITGIHGFVGSNLVKALKVNHSIYGLDLKKRELKKHFRGMILQNYPMWILRVS